MTFASTLDFGMSLKLGFVETWPVFDDGPQMFKIEDAPPMHVGSSFSRSLLAIFDILCDSLDFSPFTNALFCFSFDARRNNEFFNHATSL